MAWRVVEFGDTVWNVTCAAERRAHTSAWQLVLSFRSTRAPKSSFWAAYPLESSSKSSLFAQAERISDDRLTAVLAEHLR
jgi:hypothetical protein